jgi:hypothetical protein
MRLAFAQEGSHVVISCRREDAGRELVTELRALGVEGAEALRQLNALRTIPRSDAKPN